MLSSFSIDILGYQEGIGGVERGDLAFRMDEKEVLFNICKTMKSMKNLREVSVINRSWVT